MSASNDGLIERKALPGVPDPVLPADIANKQYVDAQMPPLPIPPVWNQQIKVANQSIPQNNIEIDDEFSIPILEAGIPIEINWFSYIRNTLGVSQTANLEWSFNGGATTVSPQYYPPEGQNTIEWITGSGATANNQMFTMNEVKLYHIRAVVQLSNSTGTIRPTYQSNFSGFSANLHSCFAWRYFSTPLPPPPF